MIDFEKRLNSLKERRQGSRERALLETYDSALTKSLLTAGVDARERESFEALNESAGVKYAVGAMAPVDKKSTEVSKKEGNRVADSLIKSLANQGESVTKRLQGSVALDIHIKGHSDVDMLIIVTNPIFIETPRIEPNTYLPKSDPREMKEIIRDVRRKSERILPNNFPAAEVDISGNKSIALSGGSLSRKVDVVPAMWYDTCDYQRSRQEHDRGIEIYHKGDHEFIRNFPFKHIKNVNDRDALYSGNLKSVVRLMKNMIADMPDYKKSIAQSLSSYDLAAIGYHMADALSIPSYLKLGLVAKLSTYLQLLESGKLYRDTLRVPDGSRLIFDNDKKVDALQFLSAECDDLARSIYKELRPLNIGYDSSVLLNKAIYGI